MRTQEYDKDNIPPEIVQKIRPYMDKEEFKPEVVQKASKAAYGLCQWVRAMEAYDRVAKVRRRFRNVDMQPCTCQSPSSPAPQPRISCLVER